MTLVSPQAGQPIDLSYIAKMVEAIGQIESTVLSNRNSVSSQIKYSDSGAVDVSTSGLKIYAETSGTFNINLAQNTGNTIPFNYPPNMFKTTPVVIATIQEQSDSSIPVFCVINNPSNSGCFVKVYSTKTDGTFSGKVSIIAVGEPN